MIVDIRKILFYGLSSDLEHLVARSQESGFIEFIPNKGQPIENASHHFQDIAIALKILKKQPVAIPYDKYLSKEELYDEALNIIALDKKLERIHEDLRITEIEVVKLKPLGMFHIEDLQFIYEHSGYKMQFFCRPAINEQALDSKLIYVGTEFDLDYFVSLSKTKLSFQDFIEIKIERSLNECLQHKERLEQHLKLTEKELKSKAVFLVSLDYALGQYHDLDEFKKTYHQASFPLEGQFFTMMAYVPTNKEAFLPKLLKGLMIQADVIKPDPDEVLPTCFSNTGLAKSGEDLVKIYDIPASTDKDPSPWVLWTFALFFAMIVSDAGYGLIYLALAFLGHFKIKSKTPSMKRGLNLLKTLGFSCVAWGMMTGSWFGISLSENNILQKATLIEYLVDKKAEYHAYEQDETTQEIQKKYCIDQVGCKTDLLDYKTESGDRPVYDMFFKNILLELSIIVGVLHVSISLLRYISRNWANIGWVLFALGGYLFFPSYLHAASLIQFLNIASLKTAAAFGYQLIYAGIAIAMGLALIQKKLKGLGEIANLVQVFADILSYLRLYALALASSIMAQTFNQMGVDLGLFFGVIAILAGHVINFVLGTMGGVIHGLRLNFIEWYHYSFEGGGKLFKPLKRFTLKS